VTDGARIVTKLWNQAVWLLNERKFMSKEGVCGEELSSPRARSLQPCVLRD
jgi:hypothetical protein